MKRIFSLLTVFLLWASMPAAGALLVGEEHPEREEAQQTEEVLAGRNNLLWDYTNGAPQNNPDRGLSYSSVVNDQEGVKNGLKGIKLNSSGWCSFEKAPVAGVLKLTFGPRSGMNPASLQISFYTGGESRLVQAVGETCKVIGLETQSIPLTADQNIIYITRLLNVETVLQKIEFVEGETADQHPCEEPEEMLHLYSADMRTDGLSKEAAYLIGELQEANKRGNTTIYLPNGVYDLGEMVLTSISANGISIIGESMEGVIIRNKPDYRLESIDRSATLRICRGVEETYLQNLTIENALDYYHDDNGRGVALWDQGTKTVCRNVRLLGHQDTYYSDCEGAKKYFEDCEIHGTVDFICGNGNVYFKECLLHCLPRSKDGSGTDALTASGAGKEDKGFVFESCVVRSECPVVSLGRSWKKTPKCVFLHTTLDFSAGEFRLEGKGIQRWTVQGMMTLPEQFGEYRTTDQEGRVLSPETNEVTFVLDGKSRTISTVLSDDEAQRYTPEYVLGEWANEVGRPLR